MDRWNPDQYNQFQDERAQPFWDLSRLIDFNGVNSLLDIGCGTGQLTAQLQEKHSLSKVLGIDSSPAMLERAQSFKKPGLDFDLADIRNFKSSQAFDVIFSNAALQWIDGHRELLGKIASWLSPNGQLAVQMPVNFDHPSHSLANDVARKMNLLTRQPPVLPSEVYAEWMWLAGFRDLNVFVKVYLHPMKSGRDVVEWTKGTLLTHFEKQLSADKFENFLAEYSQRLELITGSGPYLYTFKRIFIFGRKSD